MLSCIFYFSAKNLNFCKNISTDICIFERLSKWWYVSTIEYHLAIKVVYKWISNVFIEEILVWKNIYSLLKLYFNVWQVFIKYLERNSLDGIAAHI